MIKRFVFVPAVLIAGLLVDRLVTAGESAPGDSEKPWSESFTMILKETERTYVVVNNASYLVMKPDDLADRTFIDNKDVMLQAKLERVDRTHAHFYNLDSLEAIGGLDLWTTRLDGDNLYLFGHISAAAAGTIKLQVAAIVTAPSDGQIIAKKLQAVGAQDAQGRLAVAAWVRESGASQGNKDFWNQAADNIVGQVISDAVADATAKKDLKQIQQAMTWSLELIHDPVHAAQIASLPWIRETGGAGAEEISKRMRAIEYELYNGQWRPRAESLGSEFNDRFAAINWRDADAYYKLGRWVDSNAEILPRARELSYRCYQAGYRANPDHNGIRRELGLEAVAAGSTATAAGEGNFIDSASGIVVTGPEKWTRSEHAIDGNATWVDPQSDTAYISARVIKLPETATTFESMWTSEKALRSAKNGFTNLAEEEMKFALGQARRLRYNYREGRYVRLAEVIVAYNPSAAAAIAIQASYTESEATAAQKALTEVFAKVVVPSGGRLDNSAKPPAPTPAAPTAPAKNNGKVIGEKD